MKKLLCLLSLSLSLFLVRLSQGVAPIGNDNPTGVTGEYNGSTTTGGSYDPYTGNAKRFIDDLVVTGSIGEYPLKWTRTYNSRGGSGKFGDGGGWTHNYQWNLTLNSVPGLCGQTCICDGPHGIVTYPDGRRMNLRSEGESEGHQYYVQADGAEPMGDRIVHVPGGSGNYYDLRLKDGGHVEFRPNIDIPAGAPKTIVDPYGRRTELVYTGGQFSKLSTVTEPGGRFLQISYETRCHESWVNPPQQVCTDVISQVAAYDGRGHMVEKVVYTYQDVSAQIDWNRGVFVNLIEVAYDDGTHAYYGYDEPGLVQSGNAWSLCAGTLKTCNDPRFAGPMSKIEYAYVRPGGGQAGVQLRGQIKAEKNMATHQPVSTLDYQDGIYHRTEERPDGAKRDFLYDAIGLRNYTNFSYQGETQQYTTITLTDPAINPDNYLRAVTVENMTAGGEHITTTTTTEMEHKIGAVMSVTYHDGSKIEYTYSEPEPYYLATRKDENQKTTRYTRYPANHPNANMIQRIDYPDDGFEEFVYNNFGQVIYHLMTSGGTEIFEYDNRGLKTAYTAPITPSDQTPGQHRTLYFYYGGPSGPGEAPQAGAPPRPDLMDRLRRVIDSRGNSTWYEYNARGLVTKVTYEDNTFIQNEYYPDGTLHWTEDELHHRTTYTRDDYKRVTEVKNHLNETVTNSYASPRVYNDSQGRSHTTSSIYLTTSDMGRQIRYDYDAHFRRTMTKQAPGTADEATTNFTYDWVGNLIKVEDPRHKFTIYGYDARNRRTSTWNEELNETTTVLYDDAGNKKRETRQDQALRTWDYDAMNRLRHAYDWRPAGSSPTINQTTTYVYDHAGNVQSITDGKGAVYEYGYDWLNRKISATYPSDETLPQRTETWQYDYAGNLILHKNPAGQYQHFTYDNRNRRRRSYWNLTPDPNTAANWSIGQEITTTPDAASRITDITTNGGETVVAFQYDEANRKVWEDQTLAGQPRRRVKTELDRDGRRINLEIVDPTVGVFGLINSEEMSGSRSYSITYDYTERNQLWHIRGTGAEDWAFTYTYDPSGNMSERRADYNGRTSWTRCPNDDYDALNRPRTWEQSGPNGFHALSHHQYDKVNREKAVSRDEDGNRGERYEYEVTDQLRQVFYNVYVSPTPPPPSPTPPTTPTPPNSTPTPTPPNATPTPSQTVAMPTFNPPSCIYPQNTISIRITTATAGAQIMWTNDDSDPTPTHGTPIVSGDTMTSEYHQDFTLKARAFKAGWTDSDLRNESYVWDDGGGMNPNAIGRVVTYFHTPDMLNRSSMTDNGVTTTYSPNALNQYKSTSGNSFSYDDNFNLTHTSGLYGIYDAANRLVSASNVGSTQSTNTTVAEFVYDGLGRCVKRTLNGVATLFVFDGWKPIGEFDEWNYFQAWNVYGPGADEILLRQKDQIGYTFFLLDRHGNVAFLIDNVGAVREKCTYDVFGRPTVMDADGSNARSSSYYEQSFLFQGREYISELAIYDYRHRFYHPGLGRFIQTDPLGFDAGDMNLYRYCDDDPVDYADAMGTYAQGSGWNKDSWEKFKVAQENAAKVTGGAADRMESALKNGGKELDALKKDFERVYGPGSATEKNLREVNNTLRGMETALRDNGEKGYYANAATNAETIAHGLSKDTAAWTVPSDRHSLYVNTDHANFGKSSLVGSVIHESSHNLGLIDVKREQGGVRAYRHGNLTEQAYFKQLPFKEPDKALRNADTLTSFVVP